MNRIQEHTELATKKTAERDLLTRQLESVEKEIEAARARALQKERAREVVDRVLLLTQSEVGKFVEDVVSLALSTVYGDKYSFELEFGVRRNQPEVIPWILKDGDRFSPREEVGGGVLDVASLAARLALWALTNPRTSPVFILDEPGRFLSQDKQRAFGQMLKAMSENLNIQIIMISHSTSIIDCADVAYEITQESGLSHVREIRS